MDRFFYLITDEQQNIFVLRTHYFPMHNYLQLKDAFQKLFIGDQLLRLNYKSTKIGLISDTTTLIPADLYDASQEAFYIQHNAAAQEQQSILSDELKNIDAHQVYTFHQEILEVLQNYFHNGQFCHATSALLKSWQQSNVGNNKRMFVNVAGQHLQIAVFDQQKLLLSNTFNWRATLDISYYVVLVFNQLEMDANKIPVVLSGEITEEGEAGKILTRYIRNLSTNSRPAFYRFGRGTQELPPQAFFDLFSLKLS